MPCTTWHGPTFRISDGGRVDGAWCLVWRRHDLLDEHFVEHRFVYADGLITCGGCDATDLAGLERLLATGSSPWTRRTHASGPRSSRSARSGRPGIPSRGPTRASSWRSPTRSAGWRADHGRIRAAATADRARELA
ncbi:hypothetical protein SF23_19425, partial [Streptomyces sp. MBRL 10]